MLPTKSHQINQHIFRFNKYLCDDLVQTNLRVHLVEGFVQFVDRQTETLRNDLAVASHNDVLHINDSKGVRLLVKLIKFAIFGAKSSKVNSSRSFANATRGGPLHPV